MGYTRQNFKNGQCLKAEHLNHMEDCLCESLHMQDFLIAEDASETANVLVEDNGEAKRVPVSQFGGGVDLSGYAQKSELPTKPEDIGAQPAGNYALKTEIPAVPVQSVNGKTGAVNLSATDVNARPDNWMPTAQEVGALPSTYTPPNQTAEQVGADPKGTAASAVGSHNTNTDAHNDIRLELKAINDRLTAFFDSDNQTLDELSEIVAYITNNKTLIDSITTSKVSVADIINNLTTNVTNKPLSAAQGVALKALIDAVDSGKLDASELPTAINTALAQAKASGEFDGKAGSNGADGVGISSVKQTTTSTADGGSNVVTVTLSDGTTFTFTVKNGSKGSTGAAGKDGYTPQKYVDYWTAADQEAIVQQVITALGTPVFGRVDADKNIILSSDTLADGTYKLWFEDKNGKVSELCTLVHDADAPSYTNQIPISTDESGNIYNGVGYRASSRINSSNQIVDITNNPTNPAFVTGYIPIKNGDIIRFKNCYIDTNSFDATTKYGNKTWSFYVYFCSGRTLSGAGSKTWDSIKGMSGLSVTTDGNGFVTQMDIINQSATYIRFTLAPTGDPADAIITVNEEIV